MILLNKTCQITLQSHANRSIKSMKSQRHLMRTTRYFNQHSHYYCTLLSLTIRKLLAFIALSFIIFCPLQAIKQVSLKIHEHFVKKFQKTNLSKISLILSAIFTLIFQVKGLIPNYFATANIVIYGNLAKVKNWGVD